MNTVKRWLAGILSFAMIFTSAAFSNVGAIVTFAAEKPVVVINDDGTHSYDTFDAALRDTNLWINRPINEIRNTVIKLNADAEVKTETTVKVPLVINLNGHKLAHFDELRGSNLHNICKHIDGYQSTGYPTTMTFARHEGELVYNWVYDDSGNPAWYVRSISEVCGNCGIKDVVAGPISRNHTTYVADINAYVFRYGRYTDKRDADIDTNGWLLAMGPYIIKVNGENQHTADGKPIVKAVVTKITTGESQEVDVSVIAATKEEIEEVVKKRLNGIDRGNEEATCYSTGKIIYKAIVTDPDGNVLNTMFIKDNQATEMLPHVYGALSGYQVAIYDSGYKTRKAAENAAADLGDAFIEIVKEEKTYTVWSWNAVKPISGTRGSSDPVGEIEVPAKAIAEDGTFSYRFVYACDNPGDTSPLYGEEILTSEVYPNATTHDEYEDGTHSGCEYWTYKPITTKYSYKSGSTTVNRTFTGTVVVNGGDNTFAKNEDYFSHKINTKSGYQVTKEATCLEPGVATFTCPVCQQGNKKDEIKQLDHNFTNTRIPSKYVATAMSGYDLTGKVGDTRKVTFNSTRTEAYVNANCTFDGETYGWCDGQPAGHFPEGHFALKAITEEATGHVLSADASKGEWKVWQLEDKDDPVDITKTAGFGFYDLDDRDYTFETELACTSEGCPMKATGNKVVYHYVDGDDGYDEANVYHYYNAITIKTETTGADCQTKKKTIYTVQGLTMGGVPVTYEYEEEDEEFSKNHKYEVASWNWSKDYEAATITGYCTVKGCNDPAAHPGSDNAVVTKTVAEDGKTIFTAIYGTETDTREAYSLNDAVVTFDPSEITDANLLEAGKEAPEVTVKVGNVIIDSELYDVKWKVEKLEGNSNVLSTARIVRCIVTWKKDLDKTEYIGRAKSEWYNVSAKKEFTAYTVVYNSDDEPVLTDSVEYDPEESYSVVAYAYDKNAKNAKKAKPIEDATIKYAVYTEGNVPEDIDDIEFELDEVTGLKDAEKYHVFAQISKEGYTTYVGECEFTITPKQVFADVDNVTVVEGTMPVFNLQARDINGKVVAIDPSEYTFATLGGGELTALTPGIYKIQIVSDNYAFTSDRYNDYVCVLEVISMDDTTAVDQAKAKAAADQIEALLADPTAENLAKARELYDKLPASAKARFDAEVLKKLTDAEAAAQAKKDADAAIAAAKGYESDAAVKAALDALNAALAKGDTTEIKNATNTLNAAITAVKDAAAAKDAANAAIAAAKGYESDAAVKAALDALNAALAKGDTAAIKTATANLNNAVTAAKNKKAEKSASKITFSTKKKTIKASKVKKKAQKFQIKIKKTGNGKVTYKKSSGSKKLSVSNSGKITVKKGTKKGTYKIKVKATIAETSTYKKATKSQTIKVKVK